MATLTMKTAFLELATGSTGSSRIFSDPPETVPPTSGQTLLPHAPGAKMTVVKQTPSIEAIRFSDMNSNDQRMPTCFSACESVEKVLRDLGLGSRLRNSLEEQRKSIQRLCNKEELNIGWGAEYRMGIKTN